MEAFIRNSVVKMIHAKDKCTRWSQLEVETAQLNLFFWLYIDITHIFSYIRILHDESYNAWVLFWMEFTLRYQKNAAELKLARISPLTLFFRFLSINDRNGPTLTLITHFREDLFIFNTFHEVLFVIRNRVMTCHSMIIY
jgi:hypothetical protein